MIDRYFTSCHCPSAIRWRPNIYFRKENNLDAPVAELPAAATATAVTTAAPAYYTTDIPVSKYFRHRLWKRSHTNILLITHKEDRLDYMSVRLTSDGDLMFIVGRTINAELAGAASRKTRKPKEEHSQNETAKPRHFKEGRSDKEAAESRKIKEELSREEAAMAGVLRRRGSTGGRQSNFALEQQATVARICLSEFGFPTRSRCCSRARARARKYTHIGLASSRGSSRRHPSGTFYPESPSPGRMCLLPFPRDPTPPPFLADLPKSPRPPPAAPKGAGMSRALGPWTPSLAPLLALALIPQVLPSPHRHATPRGVGMNWRASAQGVGWPAASSLRRRRRLRGCRARGEGRGGRGRGGGGGKGMKGDAA